MTETEEDKKIVDVREDPLGEYEIIETYIHVKSGDLHRILNKRSGYLCDMLELEEKNK